MINCAEFGYKYEARALNTFNCGNHIRNDGIELHKRNCVSDMAWCQTHTHKVSAIERAKCYAKLS